MSDKTLIIGPSWVGDMVMAQALFKAIKSQFPSTTIEVLAPTWSAPLTERMPEISKSIPMPLKHGELGLKKRLSLGAIFKKKYARCFVLPNSFKSALVPFFARIPQRIGYRGEWRYPLLNDVRVLDKKKYPLMVQRYAALAYEKNQPLPSPLFRPGLVINQDNLLKAIGKYQIDCQSKPILALCPGAEFGPSKRWPKEYYARLANEYLDLKWQVWILGSQNDSEVAGAIQTLTSQRCIDLTGKTSLADAIDLMSLAKMVVSNDSGLMHIAAALNLPLVAIYGSTDPGFTPPLNDNVEIIQGKIPCSPCFKRLCPLGHHQCMNQLVVEKVIQGIKKVESRSTCAL